MIFYIGRKELDTMKNVEQIKRDLRQCYPLLDYLLESLDTNAALNAHPTLSLDLIESILCPQAQQLQVRTFLSINILVEIELFIFILMQQGENSN